MKNEVIINGTKYEGLSDAQVEHLESVAIIMSNFNESFGTLFNALRKLSDNPPKLDLPKLDIPPITIPAANNKSSENKDESKVAESKNDEAVPKKHGSAKESRPKVVDQESDSDDIILGKNGKNYIFNRTKIKSMLDAGTTKAQIAKEAGISVLTLSKYIESAGLTGKDADPAVARRHAWNEGIPIEQSPKEAGQQIMRTMRSGEIECPICKKVFYPAPQHIYKDSKGNKVCSYTCARKSGGM